MPEKPLNVQVAEALGCHSFECPPGGRLDKAGRTWYGYGLAPIVGQKEEIPRYDTDWATTGPLIERYDIYLGPDDCAHGLWWAEHFFSFRHTGSARQSGPTPLIAVCNLILKLAEKGKLGINAST